MFGIRYDMDAVIKIFSLKKLFCWIKTATAENIAIFHASIIHPQYPPFHQ